MIVNRQDKPVRFWLMYFILWMAFLILTLKDLIPFGKSEAKNFEEELKKNSEVDPELEKILKDAFEEFLRGREKIAN